MIENHLNGFQALNATRNPKLKLGENEKGALTTIMNSCAPALGWNLANAFGVGLVKSLELSS
jgi:hypothetical protein